MVHHESWRVLKMLMPGSQRFWFHWNGMVWSFGTGILQSQNLRTTRLESNVCSSPSCDVDVSFKEKPKFTETYQKASLLACSVKNLPAMQETWVRKIPWRRKWQPTPVFLPGESHGRRSLVGYSPRGRKESDTTERLHFPGLQICLLPVFSYGEEKACSRIFIFLKWQ